MTHTAHLRPILSLILPAAMVLLLTGTAGCQGSGTATKATPREQLQNQWSNARAGVLFGLARQQYEAGSLADARKSLDEAARLAPGNVHVRLLSARVFIESGQLETALRELEEVRQLDAANAEAAYLMGVIYQRWQKPENALQWYVEAAEKAPAEAAYLLARAELLVAVGRAPEALAYLQERLTYFENVASLRDAVGQILVALGEPARAVPYLREATVLAPDDLQIREHLALALYFAGDYRAAADLLGRLLSEERLADRTDLKLARAKSLLKIGRAADLADGRALLQEVALAEPGSAHVWLALAEAAVLCSDPQRAEVSVRKALALDNANPEALMLLGYLRVVEGSYDDALLAFQRAAALDPRDTVATCMIGYVLQKQGRHAQALEQYGRALQQHPQDDLAAALLAGLGND
jgi:tetratricopeptide (TPR) repeat protein